MLEERYPSNRLPNKQYGLKAPSCVDFPHAAVFPSSMRKVSAHRQALAFKTVTNLAACGEAAITFLGSSSARTANE